MITLAEIPYIRIDPIVFHVGQMPVRWYGISYVISFLAGAFVLRDLAKRGRWPVPPDRVLDVLFWGILGVFVGGRLGWVFFYGMHQADWEWMKLWKVWEGGMAFHGGLLGVIVAYWIYAIQMNVPKGALFDGLALAATPGLFLVRIANYINAELYGRKWDGPWATRFPDYYSAGGGPDTWKERGERWLQDLRHPSQLYEGLVEGLLLFLLLRWLMLRRGVGGGRIAGLFLVLYGGLRFLLEYTREPDVGLGTPFLGMFTRGQELCLGMVVMGVIVLIMSGRRADTGVPDAP
jgi:phosphatidylglycerol---prolipoprotein diacylglyceryl transferase